MNVPKQLAKHFREVYCGGNWTAVNLKKVLSDVTWQEATTKVATLNTIAVVVFHIQYYVRAVLNVLQGGALEARDKYSFDLAPIQSQQDWEALLHNTWNDAETFATMVEHLPETRLSEIFVEEKYGTYHRNMLGLIEHTHYHLGQIVLIKKILRQPGETAS